VACFHFSLDKASRILRRLVEAPVKKVDQRGGSSTLGDRGRPRKNVGQTIMSDLSIWSIFGINTQ
jgi:hypothetical protein